MVSQNRGKGRLPAAAGCDRNFVVKSLPVVAGRFSGLFKALADDSRLGILCLLAAAEAPLCACEIEERFGLSQPTMSHHLRVLRQAGLVRVERRGRWAWFELNRATLRRNWTDFRDMIGK